MSAPRVLVVDDNRMNAELVQFLLLADGLAVDTAADAHEALAVMARQLPDLILMDVQLPGIDGLTLTRQIKADAAMRHIVVVAFTAYAMKGDEAKMRAAGCDGYLSKPLTVATFASEVRTLLGDRSIGASATR